jgi:hypothetical protein
MQSASQAACVAPHRLVNLQIARAIETCGEEKRRNIRRVGVCSLAAKTALKSFFHIQV